MEKPGWWWKRFAGYSAKATGIEMDLMRGLIRIPGGHCCRVWWRSWKMRAERPTGQRRSSETPLRETEARGRKPEDGSRKTEDGRRKTEDGGRKTEDGRRQGCRPTCTHGCVRYVLRTRQSALRVRGSRFKVQSSTFDVRCS